MMGREKILEQGVSLLVPERCLLCGRLLLYREHHCCAGCLESLKPVSDYCPRCGGFFEDGKCLICGDRMWYISRNVTVMEYRKGLRELLYQFKVRQKKRLYYHFSAMIDKRLEGEEFLSTVDLIIPVPVSAKRKRQRGYNQARLMGLAVSKRTGIGIKELLKTVSRKENQKTMSYARRFLNVPGRFKVKKRADLKGKRILLIDDVLTTGATINECARVLKEAGAGDIFSVTLGRAPIKRLEK